MIKDPISFEVTKNALISCSREMSQALRRTAFSPNIKERRDCSCAIFDRDGNLIAQSRDIPVHLGAMPLSVKSCIERLGRNIAEGTMALINDPYSGGSHLPDLTLVAPIFHNRERVAFVANRAHHADIGGESPGSMPGLSLSIHDEGIVIVPRIVVIDDVLQRDLVCDILEATRTPDERLGDLSAQVAANNVGKKRLSQIALQYGWASLSRTFSDLRQYSAKMMTGALMRYNGMSGEFTDYMESDGAGAWDIPIAVAVNIRDGRLHVDFTGTSNQVNGNVNCPIASTLSAVYYVLIALFGRNTPTNEGCWSVVDIVVPEGSLLNPKYPAPVSAGNVETSQRVVDVTLGALAKIVPDLVPAASQGTMNNLTIGGIDPRTERAFSFYETIGGGSGAAFGNNGESGIHSHMTNTLNTPIESLETEYPLRVCKYSILRGTGGSGKWRGGDGIIREIEILSNICTISIQSERRAVGPWGLAGGQSGKGGKNTITYEGQIHSFQAKSTIVAPKGSIVKIETPGGGGWGTPPESELILDLNRN
ncbi:MAG: hydantoinase B/oxoprolinase family protein [Candidatus Thorarchaeota archaeon]|nr:hydantoinase B/oxoprolinase family protein [Candidatus Thorarchaeota archaeon]